MTPATRDALEASLGRISHVTPVAGGDINEAWRVQLADRRTIFVKTHGSPPPGMYAAEAAGLAWLRAGPLRVPQVIAVAESFLALEWLALGDRDRHTEAQLGRGLAQLHALGAPTFGLDRGNYLATIPQDNTLAPDVATFWIERRLRPLIARFAPQLGAGLDALARRPERFGPPERPARLHGDLWWGNVGVCDGAPVLIDPAVAALPARGARRAVRRRLRGAGRADPHVARVITSPWRPRSRRRSRRPWASCRSSPSSR